MPGFFPENNRSLPSDDAQRSLCKVVDLLGGGAGGSGGGGALSPEVFKGNYGGGVPTQTPTTTAAIAYDLDPPNRQWYWSGTGWF